MICPQLSISVNGTQKCSMNCFYCPPPQKTKDITFNQLCKGIELVESFFSSIEKKKLHFNAKDNLFLYNTLIFPTIEKFNHSYKIGIHTNGILLNDKILQQIANNKIELVISLDGPKEVQDINRLSKNGKSTFDLVWKNINLALDLGIKTTIVSTFNDLSIDYIYDTFLFFMENKKITGFNFLFDVIYSNYNYKFPIIEGLFKKISEDYSDRCHFQKEKFKYVKPFLSYSQGLSYPVIINSNSIGLKLHKHNLTKIGQWDSKLESYIQSSNYKLNQDDFCFFQNCNNNKEYCQQCPNNLTKTYKSFNGKNDLSIYCKLHTEIFKALRQKGQL